jgi:hypothetical protein
MSPRLRFSSFRHTVLLSIFLAASAWDAAKGATYYEATITCPIDGQQFYATLVGSYFQSGMRLDLKPTGALVAPTPYPVCPGNGFVIFRSDFSDDELTTIRHVVLSDEYRKLRRVNTDYFMVAYVKQALGVSHYDLALTYLSASWEAERETRVLVRPYRTLARQEFDEFVRTELSRTEEWWIANVVASELDRLLANFDAVEVRITALPTDELGSKFPALQTLLDQIRVHARAGNSDPQQMSLPPELNGTIGLAPGPKIR